MRQAMILFAALFVNFLFVSNAWTSPPLPFLSRRQVETTRNLQVYSSSSASTSQAEAGVQKDDFLIRDSQFGDLGIVADIIIKSFYPNATSPWSHMYRMGELNRIQQNFPYADKELHRMLVAVSASTGEIVGFCDIDARKAKAPSYRYNPRPYLSDLAVDPEWRRRGIARRLIETCEAFCEDDLQTNSLYIRVEEGNLAAREMYHRMNYYQSADPEQRKGTIMLKKNLDFGKMEPYIM